MGAPGRLYVVATPLGHSEDLSTRALKTLQAVDAIACEDTRHTGLLLHRLLIKRPLLSYHAHNESARTEQIIGMLREGQQIALVSDAGTPGIADPGAKLVARCHLEGIVVSPIPGPSALVATLSAAGFAASQHRFIGFFPKQRAQRREVLAGLTRCSEIVVAFESPQRFLSLLVDLGQELGMARKLCVARELTKVHEEIRVGSAQELQEVFAQRERIRGEFSIAIDAAEAAVTRRAVEEMEEVHRRFIAHLAAAGWSHRDIRDALVAVMEVRPKLAYAWVMEALAATSGGAQADEPDEAL